MLTINDLKNGNVILIDGAPHEVLSATHSHFGRGGSVVETRLKDLKTDAVFLRNFKPADTFEEANVEKQKIRFLYGHRGTYWFQNPDGSQSRFSLSEAVIGEASKFLKPDTTVEALRHNDEVISIKLPIKMDFRVIEAPPTIRGNTAQGGAKVVKIETGTELSAPLFIEEGDVIRINTETGEYAERVKKST